MAEEIIKPETKFNMSLAILEGLSNILNDIAIFSAHQELDKWYDCLRALKREFSYLLTSEEKEADKKKQEEINPIYLGYKFPKNKKGTIENINILYSKLEEYDGWLKDLLYKKGLLIIHKEDIHKAVMRR